MVSFLKTYKKFKKKKPLEDMTFQMDQFTKENSTLKTNFKVKFINISSGNGTLYFSTGKIFYSGCWKSNQFHGFGILNNIENPSQSPSNKTVEINYQNFALNDNNLWTQYEG